MKLRHLLLVLCLLVFASASGCVERKLLIRSDPPGAPAWVDEEPVGETPVTYDFEHYGGRRIRVGPVRDENGAVVRESMEQVKRIEAPWYETFPLGFFSEVVWPFTITDQRVVRCELQSAAEEEDQYGEEAARGVLEQGRSFREKAMSPAPGVE